MRLLSHLLAPALLAVAAVAAHADTCFTITGPEGNYTFTLAASAVPTYTYMADFSQAEFPLAAATYNGAGNYSSSIYLDSRSQVEFYSTYGYFYARLATPFFSGTAASPVFQPGTYTASYAEAFVSNYTVYSSSYNADHITIASTSPVPEPSSFALLSTGILALSGILRRTLIRA